MLNSVILKIKKALNDFFINKKLTSLTNLMSEEITYIDNYKNAAFNKAEIAFILSNQIIFKEPIQEIIYKKTKSYYNSSKSKVSLKLNFLTYLDNQYFYDILLIIVFDLITGKIINININQSTKKTLIEKEYKDISSFFETKTNNLDEVQDSIYSSYLSVDFLNDSCYIYKSTIDKKDIKTYSNYINKLLKFVHHDDQDKLTKLLDRETYLINNNYNELILFKNKKNIFEEDYRIKYPGEEEYHYERTCLIFMRNDNNTYNCVITTRDVNEIKLKDKIYENLLIDAKLKAESANIAKSVFLSNMSHDIRTPLNGILGLTQIASENLDNPEKMKGYINNITLSGEHLLSLINNILDMSKIESGKLSISNSLFSLHELIDDVSNIINPQINKKNQEYIINYNNIIHDYLVGDNLKLQQIFINVLGNANKFTPSFGKIIFNISENPINDYESIFTFEIIDNGAGISKEFLPYIFNAFSQEDTHRQGSGLGLSITKGLITLLEGTINVESEVGCGSKFIITLKLGTKSNKINFDTKTVEEINENVLNGKHILLADDEKLNREIMVELLSSWGLNVTCAIDGDDALNKYFNSCENYYDLILLDILMPKLDGHETSIKIRNSNRSDSKSIPIFALSANAFQDDIEKSLRHGINKHIPKPINFNELKLEIIKALTK